MRKRKVKRQIEKARTHLKDKDNVLVFTGSGASQPSGLPTFTGEQAVVDWGIDQYRSNPNWRRQIWHMMFDTYWSIKANPAHEAINRFVLDGKGTHVTSNVDGLAPGIELCGSACEIRCDECGRYYDKDETKERWENGDPDPRCVECVGMLRPDVVFIGESFEVEPWTEFEDAIDKMEALVVVGASPLIGTWWPAVDYAKEHRIPIISINMSPHPWKKIAGIHLQGDAAQITPQLLG